MSIPIADDRAATGAATPRPRLRTISAVINPAAGGVRPGADAQLRALVAEHGYALDLFSVGPHDVDAVVRKAVDSAPDLLVVLAGDGTARLAAQLCGPEGPLLAPLAGGTLNMLPHALYGAAAWREALHATLTDGVEQMVSGGRVCGHSFYVAAVLGAPALWGQAREALRAGKLGRAVRRVELAVRRAFAGGLRYGAESQPGRRGEALVLICPLVSKAIEHERALELAALDFHDARELMRLAFGGLTGAWRSDPSVSVELVQHGWASMRGSIPSILDGETHRLPHRAEFEFVPQAFRALAPPDVAVSSL
jgi:diacylglycerol kinase family enzyme